MAKPTDVRTIAIPGGWPADGAIARTRREAILLPSQSPRLAPSIVGTLSQRNLAGSHIRKRHPGSADRGAKGSDCATTMIMSRNPLPSDLVRATIPSTACRSRKTIGRPASCTSSLTVRRLENMSMRSGSYRLRSPTVEVERRTTETAEGETLWGSRGLLGGAGTLHRNQMLFQLPDETEQPEARWLTEQNALQRRVFDLL